MGKSIRQIPSFDQVMGEEDPKKKPIPTFDQVMGGELKKKDGGSAVGTLNGSGLPLNVDQADLIKSIVTKKPVEQVKQERVERMTPKTVTPTVKQVDAKVPYSPDKINKKAEERVNEVMFGDDWRDPVKGVAKLSKGDPADPIDIAVTKRANDIIKNNLAGDGFDAKRILNDGSFRGEGNLTEGLLIKKAADYDKNTASVRELPVVDLTHASPEYLDYNFTPALTNAAIKFAAGKDSQFKQNLDDMDIDLNDPVLYNRLNSGIVGRKMREFLNDKDIQTYITKEAPELLPAFERAKKTIRVTNKDFGVNEVANEVSQAIQKSGFNAIDPVFNYNSNQSKEYANQIAEQLYRDDPESMAIYNQNIRDNQDQYLDKPSFFQGFAEAGKQVGEGIGSTFTAPFTDRGKNIEEQMVKEANHVSANPEGFVGFMRGLGHGTGFVVSLAAGGELLSGAGMSPAAAQKTLVGTTMFGDFLKEAERKYKSPVKAFTSASLQTLGMASLSNIFPSAKLNAAFKEVKPELSRITSDLVKGSITREAAKDEVFNTIQKAIDWGKKSGIQNLKASGEMTAFEVADKGLDKLMGLNDQTYDKYHYEGQEWDTFKTMFLNNSLVSGVTGIAEMKRNTKEGKAIAYDIASNPRKYERLADEIQASNPSVKASDLKEKIKTLGDAKKELDLNKIPVDEQKTYLVHAKNEIDLREKAAQTNEPSLKKKYETEAKKSAEVKEGILKGLTEDQVKERQAIKDVKELYNEDFLTKAQKELLESKETPESEGKFDEKKVKGFLEFVSQKANNVDAEGNFVKSSDARKANKFSKKLIELADEMFPENRKTAEEFDTINTKTEPVELDVELPDGYELPNAEVTTETNIHELPKPKKPSRYKGYVEDIGGLPDDKAGYNQDRKMRAIADGFIGEIKRDGSISYKSADEISKRYGAKLDWDKESGDLSALNKDSKIVMLARNWEYNDKPLSQKTKDAIKKAADNGAEFILSDMKGVDTQFMDYLQEIDAPFTVYATKGNEPLKGLTDSPNYKIDQLSPNEIIETNKLKKEGGENAIPIRESTPISVDETPGSGGKVGEGIFEPKEPSGTQKESKDTSEKEVAPISEGGNIGGITHAANEVRRQDRKLPEYEKSPESFEEWNNEAEKQIKEGYDVEKLVDKIKEGYDPNPVENAINKIYIATLDAEVKKNPTDELLSKQKKFIEARDLANSRAGRNLVSIKGEGSPLSTISDFYVAKMEAAGVDKLTEQQKAETKQAFENVEKANADADAKLKLFEQENAKLKAENELLKQVKEASKKKQDSGKGFKKTREDFVKERIDLKEELKAARKEHEDWLKNQGIKKSGLGSFTIKEAKVVAKIVKSYAEEGVVKLQEMVSKVFDEVKDIFPGITEKDIHDVIAGEYAEKKKTRSELAAIMRDLKDEAYYINKLERLLNGTEPKTEKEKVKRNQEITELQKKIKDFQKDQPPTDTELKSRLTAIKTRNETAEKEIRERIKKGDFETKKQVPFLENEELKKKFPKLYNEVLDAIVKREEARHEFDIALLRDELKRRNLGQKATDLLSKTVGTAKAIVTGIDDSAVAIQTYMSMLRRPRTGLSAFGKHIEHAFSQKKFNRWLAELHNSSDWKFMKDAGLDVTEPQSLKEREKEEIFSNRFNGTVKIKGKEYKLIDAPLRPFERAFTTLGNVTRVVGFRTISQKYLDEGYSWEENPELFKSLAKRLNTETGRGDINEYVDKANKVVTMGIWSPKLMAAKFNILGISDVASLALSKAGTKGYYRQLHPKERAAAIRDVVQFAVTVAALSYGLAYMAGGDVDDDPLSSTFMDIRMPNGKSYNFTGGFSGYIRAIAQFAAGGKKEGDQFKEKNRLDIASRFFRGKTPPMTSAAINLLAKKNYMGQPTTVKDEAINAISPISVKGIVEQIKKDGAMSFFTQGMPTFFGVNVKDEKDYQKNSTQKKPEKSKKQKKTVNH